MHRGASERAINAEALRRVLAAAERDAADLGSRVVGSDNLLRALVRDDAFVAGVLKRLDVDEVEFGRVQIISSPSSGGSATWASMW